MKGKRLKIRIFFTHTFLVTAFIILNAGCRTLHHPDAQFAAEDMQKDLFWLQTKVLDYHPACIDSIRFDSVATAFQMAHYEAAKPMDELQYLKLLSVTLNTLRCGHTAAIPSKSFLRYYQHARPKPFFPIQVYAKPSGLYVRYNGSNDATIRPGDRILSINQVSARSIADAITEFVPADGYHKSFKNFHLSLNFPTYYLFLKGPGYSYDLGLVDSLGRFSSHVFTLRNQGKPTTRPQQPRSVKILKTDSYRTFGYLRSNAKVAYLQVYGFGGNSNWYRKVFAEIEKKKYEYLVLDLRGNSGGNLFKASQLLSYLLEDTFSLRFEREKKKVQLNGNSDLDLSMRLSMKVWDWLPPSTSDAESTCDVFGSKRVYRFRYEPSLYHHFQGKMLVLMDGGTFSASSMVAAMLRKKMQIPLIGEESGGAASGTNAMMMPTLTLPRTKMRVTLPLYYLNFEMGKQPFRGLQPDVRLEPNIELNIKGIDSELEYLARHPEVFK